MKLCWTAFAVALGLGLSAADAGTLKVSPIKVTLPADGRTEVIHLKNPDARSTLVQVHAVEWAEADNLDQAKRVDEILAIPPIFELGPESEQVIRLALRNPGAASKEKAYRLLLTEVPEEIEGGGISFAVRLNIPLFVTPKGAEPEPLWRFGYTQSGEAELVLANHGNAHLMVKSLALRGAGQERTLFETDQFAYALAGSEQRWSLGYGQQSLPKGLEVHAETHLGPQQAPVMTP